MFPIFYYSVLSCTKFRHSQSPLLLKHWKDTSYVPANLCFMLHVHIIFLTIFVAPLTPWRYNVVWRMTTEWRWQFFFSYQNSVAYSLMTLHCHAQILCLYIYTYTYIYIYIPRSHEMVWQYKTCWIFRQIIFVSAKPGVTKGNTSMIL